MEFLFWVSVALIAYVLLRVPAGARRVGRGRLPAETWAANIHCDDVTPATVFS